MTIELPPEIELQIREEAEQEGLAPDRFILSAVEERLHRKQAERSVPRLSKAESELMQRINKGLPAETWQQYRTLRAKCRAETLMPEEHQTLISLSNQVEMVYSQRLGLILELSQIHGTSLDAEMEALGIPRYSYE